MELLSFETGLDDEFFSTLTLGPEEYCIGEILGLTSSSVFTVLNASPCISSRAIKNFISFLYCFVNFLTWYILKGKKCEYIPKGIKENNRLKLTCGLIVDCVEPAIDIG